VDIDARFCKNHKSNKFFNLNLIFFEILIVKVKNNNLKIKYQSLDQITFLNLNNFLKN